LLTALADLRLMMHGKDMVVLLKSRVTRVPLALLFASAPLAAADLPARAIILPSSTVGAILKQCSRLAPAAGEGTWQPAAADIKALEAALTAKLASTVYANSFELKAFPKNWLRQYVGIIRLGHHFIYGSFALGNGSLYVRDLRRQPVIVCDGGTNFFGAEYDVQRRTFTQIDFNGPV
jgi:hypothetical protein